MKKYKIYHLTWNSSSIRTKPYFINDWQPIHWLTLKRITRSRFMERFFVKWALKICDKAIYGFICNIANLSISDRNLMELQYHNTAISQNRKIAISQYRKIARHNRWQTSVNAFSCETRFAIYVISHWWFVVFQHKIWHSKHAMQWM